MPNTIEEKIKSILNLVWEASPHNKDKSIDFGTEEINSLIKKEKIDEYKKGFNACLKERGLTGEEHQNLYL